MTSRNDYNPVRRLYGPLDTSKERQISVWVISSHLSLPWSHGTNERTNALLTSIRTPGSFDLIRSLPGSTIGPKRSIKLSSIFSLLLIRLFSSCLLSFQDKLWSNCIITAPRNPPAAITWSSIYQKSISQSHVSSRISSSAQMSLGGYTHVRPFVRPKSFNQRAIWHAWVARFQFPRTNYKRPQKQRPGKIYLARNERAHYYVISIQSELAEDKINGIVRNRLVLSSVACE